MGQFLWNKDTGVFIPLDPNYKGPIPSPSRTLPPGSRFLPSEANPATPGLQRPAFDPVDLLTGGIASGGVKDLLHPFMVPLVKRLVGSSAFGGYDAANAGLEQYHPDHPVENTLASILASALTGKGVSDSFQKLSEILHPKLPISSPPSIPAPLMLEGKPQNIPIEGRTSPLQLEGGKLTGMIPPESSGASWRQGAIDKALQGIQQRDPAALALDQRNNLEGISKDSGKIRGDIQKILGQIDELGKNPKPGSIATLAKLKQKLGMNITKFKSMDAKVNQFWKEQEDKTIASKYTPIPNGEPVPVAPESPEALRQLNGNEPIVAGGVDRTPPTPFESLKRGQVSLSKGNYIPKVPGVTERHPEYLAMDERVRLMQLEHAIGRTKSASKLELLNKQVEDLFANAKYAKTGKIPLSSEYSPGKVSPALTPEELALPVPKKGMGMSPEKQKVMDRLLAGTKGAVTESSPAVQAKKPMPPSGLFTGNEEEDLKRLERHYQKMAEKELPQPETPIAQSIADATRSGDSQAELSRLKAQINSSTKKEGKSGGKPNGGKNTPKTIEEARAIIEGSSPRVKEDPAVTIEKILNHDASALTPEELKVLEKSDNKAKAWDKIQTKAILDQTPGATTETKVKTLPKFPTGDQDPGKYILRANVKLGEFQKTRDEALAYIQKAGVSLSAHPGIQKIFEDLKGRANVIQEIVKMMTKIAEDAVGKSPEEKKKALELAKAQMREVSDIGTEDIMARLHRYIPERSSERPESTKKKGIFDSSSMSFLGSEAFSAMAKKISTMIWHGQAADLSAEWFAPSYSSDVDPAMRQSFHRQVVASFDWMVHESATFWDHVITPRMNKIVKGKDLDTFKKAAYFWIERQNNPAKADALIPIILAKHPEYKKIFDRMASFTDEEKNLVQQGIEYDQDRGKKMVKEGILDQYREFHMNHLYESEGKIPDRVTLGGGTKSTVSRFAKHRVFDTMFDAIAAGMKPKNLDWIEVNKIADSDAQRTILSKRTFDWLKGEDLLHEAVEGEPSLFENSSKISFNGKEAHIPTEVDKLVGFMFETNPLKGLQKVTSFEKRLNQIKGWNFMLGFFHDMNLTRILFTSHPLRFMKGFVWKGMVRKQDSVYAHHQLVNEGIELMKNPPPAAEKLIRSGLTLGFRSVIESEGEMLKSNGVLSGAKDFIHSIDQAHHRELFAVYQPALKMWDAYNMFQKQLPKMLAKGYKEDDIAESVAALMNKQYGGLNWNRMGTKEAIKRLSRFLLLAPDWTISKGMQATSLLRASHDPIQTEIARKRMGKMLATWFFATQAVNIYWTGNTTFSNPSPHQFDIRLPETDDQGRPMYISPFSFGILNEVISLMKEGFGGALEARLAPAPKFVSDLKANQLSPGKPIFSDNISAGQEVANVGEKALEAASPFAATAISKSLFGNRTFEQGLGSTMGIPVSRGPIMTDHQFMRLPYRLRAEFIRGLTPQESARLDQERGSGKIVEFAPELYRLARVEKAQEEAKRKAKR